MRLCKRVLRGTFRKWFKRNIAHWEWGMSLKPGDLINACGSSFNRVIAKVDIDRRQQDIACETERGYKCLPRSSMVWGIYITDTCGGSHEFPSGGCVQRPEKFTPEQIAEILTDRYKAIMEERGWVVDENVTETPKVK